MIDVFDSIRTVGEVMSGHIYSLTRERKVSEAAKMMTENQITSVLILEDDQLIGILTETDIVRRVIAKGLSPEDVTLADVMTKDVLTIHSSASIVEAGKILDENKIKKLPVVDDGVLKGIITNTDFVKSLSSSIMEIRQFTEDEIIDGPTKYDLKPGVTYLVEEAKPAESYKMFSDLVKHGVPGLCITRRNPEIVKKEYGLSKTVVLWLTEITEYRNRVSPQLGDGDVNSMYLEEIFMVLTKFLNSKKSVIMIDGLSYMVTINDFKRVLHLIDYVGDRVAESESYFILNANPKTLSERELALLEEEMDETMKP